MVADGLDRLRSDVAPFQLLSAHRFYNARQIHKHFGAITDALAAAKNAKLIGDQVVHLADALSEFPGLWDTLDTYYDVDARRRNPILKPDAIEKFSFQLTVSKGWILTALKCGVAQMREPN
jgi:hypothetical protein